MRKLLISVLFVGSSIVLSYSQSIIKCANGKVICCDPTTACGPAGTKVAEAKIISDLRNEIADFKNMLGQGGVEIKDPVLSQSELKKLPLDIENNPDDASLLMLYMEVVALKGTLDGQGPAPKSFDNKAQFVSSLKEEVAFLKNEWVAKSE